MHDITPAANLLHGVERVVYADAGTKGSEKRVETKSRENG
jgi:IS5 family transposase